MAVGVAAGLLTRPPAGWRTAAWCAALCVVALAPDADIVGFALRVPYAAEFGHRGATHAVLLPLLVGFALARWSGTALVVAAVYASHGVLDTFTDGGLGAALLWPFSPDRFFAPWRPIPVAPIGAALFSPPGLRLMAMESLMFLPLVALAAAIRRSEPSS